MWWFSDNDRIDLPTVIDKGPYVNLWGAILSPAGIWALFEVCPMVGVPKIVNGKRILALAQVP